MENPSGKLANADETKIENNGTCVIEAKEKENEVLEVVNSPPAVMAKSPWSSPLTSKGKGLKKWRRIKRETNGEGGSNVDTSKLLKRGLSNSAANMNRPMQFSAETKQNSEGSVSSTNAMVRSFGGVDHFAAVGDLGLGIGPILAARTESESSEDRSSKSSTAASAPKIRYQMPVVGGFARDKKWVRSLDGKNSGNSVQFGNQGKVRTETSKKLRGELVKIEKENSHSSMESDSRSSNFVFMQANNSATSNGRQRGRSMNYDGENSDEAQGTDQQPRAGSSRKNGGEFEVTSQENLATDFSWGTKEEKSENNGPSRDVDPLVESIITLQSVQEELEKEVHKLKEIVKEDITDDSVQDGSSGDLVQQSFDSLELEVISLKEMVNSLESKLDDTTALLKVKEAKIAKLEPVLSSGSPKEETVCAVELHQENHRDMELEGLFKQKIEAEVEYLVISQTIRKLRVSVVDQMTILEDQQTKQAQMLSKLGDAEVKASMLKGQSEKLENICQDIVSADETLKLKTSVWKYTSCFFLQSTLLAIILTLFLWQLSPHYTDVVPT